jgi:serine/threonine protein phosphatase PrpC
MEMKWEISGKGRNSPNYGYYMLLIITAPGVRDHLSDREVSTALFLHSRHVLDQTVGCSICEPETGCLEFKNEDLLILTTDGLHKKIAADTMISLLKADTDLETKAKSLVEAALDSGDKDNITIVIAERS